MNELDIVGPVQPKQLWKTLAFFGNLRNKIGNILTSMIFRQSDNLIHVRKMVGNIYSGNRLKSSNLVLLI